MILVWIIKGIRNVEFMLLSLFCFAFLFAAIRSNLSEYALLYLCSLVVFEVCVLLFFYGEVKPLRKWNSEYDSALNMLIVTFSLALIPYVISNLFFAALSGDIAQYFWMKRAAAHAGQGIDATSPFYYRLINLSMVANVFLLYRLLCIEKMEYKLYFIFFLLLSGVSSLLEGNRSTLIVPLVTMLIMYFFYCRNIVSILKISVSFVLFFCLSQIIFRNTDGFSMQAGYDTLNWFLLYLFGSVAAFPAWLDSDIDLYWKSFDVLANKFGVFNSYAKDFFIIESVESLGKRTNVFTGYAVLIDYLGKWVYVFLLFKIFIYKVIVVLVSKFKVIYPSVFFLVSSFPLVIYHEYFITNAYYFFNCIQFVILLFFYFYILKFFKKVTLSGDRYKYFN
jgi:oligosaccharide repeat unit polymerase